MTETKSKMPEKIYAGNAHLEQTIGADVQIFGLYISKQPDAGDFTEYIRKSLIEDVLEILKTKRNTCRYNADLDSNLPEEKLRYRQGCFDAYKEIIDILTFRKIV